MAKAVNLRSLSFHLERARTWVVRVRGYKYLKMETLYDVLDILILTVKSAPNCACSGRVGTSRL
jgi:hypothetical protein